MIVYGQPYLSGRKVVKPFIDIPALQPFRSYGAYRFCAALVSDKPIEIPPVKNSKASTDEWLSVFRRTVLRSGPKNLNKPISGKSATF